jgi:uncharacterized protein
MDGLFKINARPRLKAPVMLASWPGVGNVSLIVATYLRRKLDFKNLAEIEPSYFFDPIGVLVKDHLVEEPQFPQSRFYYFKNKAGKSDVILFIGEDQPSSKGYELANCIMDLGERYGVTRVYTCAAALSQIHHSEIPRAWGVGTNQGLLDELKQNNLVHKGNIQIAGLNGLLLGVAKERGVDGVCVLGEVPMNTTRIPNPMAALAVVRVLMTMLQVEVDLTELNEMANETAARMKEVAAEVMGEYIDMFTQPIWEQGQEEEEEGEEDDE